MPKLLMALFLADRVLRLGSLIDEAQSLSLVWFPLLLDRERLLSFEGP
jgi:hypothetical protein